MAMQADALACRKKKPQITPTYTWAHINWPNEAATVHQKRCPATNCTLLKGLFSPWTPASLPQWGVLAQRWKDKCRHSLQVCSGGLSKVLHTSGNSSKVICMQSNQHVRAALSSLATLTPLSSFTLSIANEYPNSLTNKCLRLQIKK